MIEYEINWDRGCGVSRVPLSSSPAPFWLGWAGVGQSRAGQGAPGPNGPGRNRCGPAGGQQGGEEPP